MKKIVLSVILSIYFIISLFVTICLLSKNQYNATELFNKVVITSNDIDDKTGKLILINKEKDYKINDEIFYYDSYVPSLKVDSSSIVSIEKITERENTLTLKNGRYLSSEFVIGKSFIQIPLIGYIIDIMSSKIGYLLLVILPILSTLIYGIIKIIKINKGRNNEK